MMEKEAAGREAMEQCVEDRRGEARRRSRRGTLGGVMIYMYAFIINICFLYQEAI